MFKPSCALDRPQVGYGRQDGKVIAFRHRIQHRPMESGTSCQLCTGHPTVPETTDDRPFAWPWVQVPDMVNAAILISAWSAAASDIYISSRFLFFLARRGHAPTWLAHLFRYPRVNRVRSAQSDSDSDSAADSDTDSLSDGEHGMYGVHLFVAAVIVNTLAWTWLLAVLQDLTGDMPTCARTSSWACLRQWRGTLMSCLLRACWPRRPWACSRL